MSVSSAFAFKWWRQVVNQARLLRQQPRLKVYFVLGFAALCEVGLGLLFYRSFRILDQLGGMGSLIMGRLFSLFFLGVGLMLVMSSLVTSYATLFRSEDLPFLMSSPMTPARITVQKYLEAGSLSSWAFFFVVVPYVVAYAAYSGLPLAFGVWTLLFSVPYLFLCSGLGTMLVMLLVRWIPRGRVLRNVLVGAAAVALLAAVTVYRRVYDPSLDARLNLGKLVPGMVVASNILVPSSWVAEGIGALTGGQWARGLPLWGLLAASAAAVFAAVEWLGERGLYECWQRALGASGRSRYTGRAFRAAEALCAGAPGDVRALVLKDVKTFVRDPVQWSQALVFFGLLGVYFLNLRTVDYSIFGPHWTSTMAFLNVFSVCAVVCSLGARFIYPQLSLEGHGFWILGLAPTTMRRVLLAKFAAAAAAMVSVSVALMLLSTVMLRTPRAVQAVAAGVAGALALSVCGLSTGLGAVYLDLRQRNPAAIVSGFGGTLNLVLGLGVMLGMILPFGVLFHLAAIGRLPALLWSRGVAVCTAWLLLLSAAATVAPLLLGIRALRHKDY